MQERVVMFYSKDVAGKNIVDFLRDKHVKAEIIEVKQEILYIEDMGIRPEVCVVASRHKSDSRIPVLTTHSPGNFNAADYGGRDRELSIAPALYLREALMQLKREGVKLQYEVSYEATHHGPTSLRFPIMFVEVGSDEEHWRDREACEAAAEAIEGLIGAEPPDLGTAIAFGGGHYCRRFSLLEEYAIGHICPKHNLPKLDIEMIEQMISKTTPTPEIALIEKKGMGREKKRVIGLLEQTGLDVVKV
ncbi:MAG: D-aminoacyl-tRNA deacylase [Candidatus Altiarchaeota archaeon]|nr:D-aminoacyl-tRNA deacylase [Candidatus Altiarchaeota archaeon]